MLALGGGELPTGDGAGGTNALEGGVLGLVISGTVVHGTKRSTCTICVLCVLICCILTTTSDLKFVIRYGPNQSGSVYGSAGEVTALASITKRVEPLSTKQL